MRHLPFVSLLLVLSPAFCDELKPAGDNFLLTKLEALDPADCRTKALAAEQAQDWPAALTLWERVIDRCIATEDQRVEARAHIKDLRPKVTRNTDPQKAHPWKVLVLIFRQLDFSWTDDKDKAFEAHKTVSEADEKKIRTSLDCFAKHVLNFSSGMLRLDLDIKVIDEPLTKLAAIGKNNKPPFSPAPHIVKSLIEPLLKDKPVDTVMCYVKYNGDKGANVPAPFVAATFGCIREFAGAGYIMVPWHTNYPFPGETDGEMETHEWLHQIDWMFCNVLHYPKELPCNPDKGRMEGDNSLGKDMEYARKKSETTWIRFYQHIMEDHITRQMWTEATAHVVPGQPLPGELIKPKK
ncbi:MAG TPA: hypothetical protein VGP72_11215 [Planctomycetota bacterium]|jgi:hypothetical protein